MLILIGKYIIHREMSKCWIHSFFKLPNVSCFFLSVKCIKDTTNIFNVVKVLKLIDAIKSIKKKF